MGKLDIESWLASTGDGSILDREEDLGTFILGNALDDWPAFILKAQAHIFRKDTRSNLSFNRFITPFCKE